jgi:hypothetical protein
MRGSGGGGVLQPHALFWTTTKLYGDTHLQLVEFHSIEFVALLR